MPGDSAFLPPVQFSPVWALLGLAILVLSLVWFVAVPLLTRARKIPVERPQQVPDLATVRIRYLTLIDEVQASHERFELTAREAHQRLSALVRAFAHESSVHPASSMTLSELKRLELPRLAGAVEKMYPAEFGTREQGNLGQAVDEARRVVLEWP